MPYRIPSYKRQRSLAIMDIKRTTGGLVAAILAAAAVVAVPVYAHHSFSIFDASQTKTFTGVVTRVNPDANHLQIFFAPMNEERKNVLRNDKNEPIVWAVEMAGSAASAQQGISVSAFPAGNALTEMPCCADAAEPAISTAHTMGSFLSLRSTFLRSSFIGAKKICKWFASGFTRVTTPVKVFVWLASKIENEWCAYTGTATTAAAARMAATRPPVVRLMSIIARLLCLL